MLRERHPGEVPMYEEQMLDNWSAAIEWTPPLNFTQVAAPATVRLCRDLAQMIGASHFSLFFITDSHESLQLTHESLQLTPAFDCAFPGRSSLSRAFCAPLEGGFVPIAATATAPLWWHDNEMSSPLDADAGTWATEITNPLADAPITGTMGVAFPVAQEHGHAGVVVFTGKAMMLDEAMLCEVHASCHALFSEVAQQRPLASDALPNMSKREIECLRLTANGFTSEDIASSLGLSVHTANQYLTSSAQKLNAVNRIHAVAKALRAGLID